LLYKSFRLSESDLEPIKKEASEILRTTVPLPGRCTTLSAAWAGYVRQRNQIPMAAVTGSLFLNDQCVFRYDSDQSIPRFEREHGLSPWPGHCWVEVDGWLGDISLLRTAHTDPSSPILRPFVEKHFEKATGAVFKQRIELEAVGMYYVPMHVITKQQERDLVKGFLHELDLDVIARDKMKASRHR
jgi:hypothetical protein